MSVQKLNYNIHAEEWTRMVLSPYILDINYQKIPELPEEINLIIFMPILEELLEFATSGYITNVHKYRIEVEAPCSSDMFLRKIVDVS
jgi:hypothetical protein